MILFKDLVLVSLLPFLGMLGDAKIGMSKYLAKYLTEFPCEYLAEYPPKYLYKKTLTRIQNQLKSSTPL